MAAKHGTVTLLVLLPLVVAVSLTLACDAKETPFALGDRATPTPTVTPMPTPTMETGGARTQETSQTDASTEIEAPNEVDPDEIAKNLVKIAQWEDKRVQLTNYIAGYIITHGLQRPVRIVEMESDASGDALATGDVDLVLAMDATASSDDVLAIGPALSSQPDVTIGVYVGLKERASEVVEFLEKFQPPDEVIDKLSARMTGGRLGLKASVTALIFLKNNEDEWTEWVDQTAVDNVRAAIEKGNNSLCREWVIRRLAETFRQCKDDPGMVVHIG